MVDRAYNSLAADTFSILSPRWTFDVGPATGLTVESDQDVTVSGPSGYRIRFARQANGSYVPPAGFDGSLTKTSAGWTLVRTSQSDEFGFDNSGTLTWTKDAVARDFTVQGTSAAGRTVLSSYGTASGRRVNLSYTGDSLVRLMDDPASGHHDYRYTNGRLTEYESPTGAKTTYRYDTNGLLDKITEPGGTTVELDVAASGRVHAITTTLPGGVPQTTSFVYTRRSYKSDVTGPDEVRRTYAYDDDWRVTRQYNPDVVPEVTATGELRDLEDEYVGPNRTYPATVSATQPDGAGLRRLAIERTSGIEISAVNVPCTSTPFDLVCPTTHSDSVPVDFSAVPEGRRTIRAIATDDEENQGTSAAWDVLVDKTPPTPASDFQLSFFDPEDDEASATINWNVPEDPELPGGVPGSGIVKTEARYRIGTGSWSPWLDSTNPIGNEDGEDEVGDGDLAIFGGQNGQQVTVEVRSTDAVGNVSPVATGTVTLAEQLEDPVVEAMINEYFADEYGMSASVGSAWQRVLNRSVDLGPEVSAALPPVSYGGTWLDNATRRIKVGVTNGTDPAPAQQVINQQGMQAHTDIVEVQHTQRQLEEGLIEINDALQSLAGLGVHIASRNPAANRVEIKVAASATTTQRTQMQAAANAASVTVAVINSPDDTLVFDARACNDFSCDGPLRGGVRFLRENEPGGFLCTTGFVGRSRSFPRSPVIFTAGHCLSGIGAARLGTMGPNHRRWQEIGARAGAPVYGARGDAGLISIDPNSRYHQASLRRPIVYVRRSGPANRQTNYPIRQVKAIRKGDPVCTSGARTGRTSCGEIHDLGVSGDVRTDGGGTVSVNGFGLIRGAGCWDDGGDSGGPVFRKGVAYGTHTGTRRYGFLGRGGCEQVYQGAAGAQELLDADIAVRR